MSSNIIKSLSRYVVPFYFEYEKNGYDKIRKHFAENSAINAEFNESLGLPKDGKWLAKGFWENYKSDKDTQAEMELYSYLPSVFAEDEKSGKKDVSNLGCSFVFKSNGSLAQLEYRYKKDKTVTF